MKLESFETILVLLLFMAPGAVFLYAFSRRIEGSERARYIQEQFPFELSGFYVVASAAIHSVLLTGCLLILSLISAWANEPQIHSKLFQPLSNIVSADTSALLLILLVVLAYFFTSLGLGYFAGIWWSKHYVPTIPKWCRQILQLQAIALTQQEIVQLELTLQNQQPSLEGEWYDFKLLSGKRMTFEVAIRQPKKNQVIWIPSSLIAKMDVRSTQGTIMLVLGHQPPNWEDELPSEEAIKPTS